MADSSSILSFKKIFLQNYTLIWLNTKLKVNLLERLIYKAKNLILTDGATNHILEYIKNTDCNFTPDAIIGDFDSISTEARQYFAKDIQINLSHDQDTTDLQKAISLAQKQNPSTILICGKIGSRWDHMFSIFSTLYDNLYNRNNLYLIDGDNICFILPAGQNIIDFSGIENKFEYIGLFSFDDNIVTTTGLKWDLQNNNLKMGGLSSSSNQIIDKKVTINCSHKVLITLYCNQLSKLFQSI